MKTNIPTIDIKKYGGQQVAIVDGSIVASGQTLEEVIKKARKHHPSRPLHEIKVFSVPLTIHTIYHDTFNRLLLRHHA